MSQRQCTLELIKIILIEDFFIYIYFLYLKERVRQSGLLYWKLQNKLRCFYYVVMAMGDERHNAIQS